MNSSQMKLRSDLLYDPCHIRILEMLHRAAICLVSMNFLGFI